MLLSASFASCKTTDPYGRELPSFYYNHYRHDSWMVNRKPEYGITGRDGCATKSELKLTIRRLNDKIITGRVAIVNGEPCRHFANVLFFCSDTTYNVPADSNGNFSFVKRERINKIEAHYFMSRTLTIDLSRSRREL